VAGRRCVVPHLNDLILTRIHIFYLEHRIGFQLRRWVLKIMSLLISANRLFILTQSNRLRKIILGKFSVQVLTSPTTAPYRCDLSSRAVQVALNAALAGTDYLSANWDRDRESFINRLKRPAPSLVVRRKPTVHAEIAMVMAMVKGEIRDVLPYIGVSKLSCIMCTHYIRAFNEVMTQKIAIRGSHGKAYPGWSWPIPPSHDEELRQAFLKRIRQQLLHDFVTDSDSRRRSDSSVGSDGPEWQLDPTADDIEAMDIEA
jgi:DNA-binding transcriptional ArsR family regulator